MAMRSIINRNYVCCFCGRMRRAPAAYIAGAPPAPQCCGCAMRLLSYEQTVAGARFSPAERVSWLSAGGKVVERGGKRGWKAVW